MTALAIRWCPTPLQAVCRVQDPKPCSGLTSMSLTAVCRVQHQLTRRLSR